jgi:hypothetical protein
MKIHNAYIPDLRYKISKEHEEETALAIKEYDEMKRKLEGEKKPGGDRQSIHYSVINDQGWTQEKTSPT